MMFRWSLADIELAFNQALDDSYEDILHPQGLTFGK